MPRLRIHVIIAFGLVVGCSQRTRLRPIVDDYPSTSGEGGGSYQPSLVQRTVPTGSTATDPTLGIRYEVENATPEMAAALVPIIQSNVAYFDLEGSRTEALVVLDPPPTPTVDSIKGPALAATVPPAVTILPAQALRRDAWYVLRVLASRSYRIKPLDSRRSTLDVRFFTGSAPTVRYLLRSTISKGKGESVQVVMSEPVSLAMLSRGGFVLSGAKGALDGCVYREGQCLGAGSAVTNTGFDFQLEQPLDINGLARATFSGDVKGSGRSVAQAAALLATPLDSSVSSGRDGVSFAVLAADWFSCGDAISCWAPSPAIR
jgi:hypothetical protein